MIAIGRILMSWTCTPFSPISKRTLISLQLRLCAHGQYLSATRQTGANRLPCESIEHTSKKRFAHPPADAAKWADVCLGIIRHYNEGWAKGFRHDIRYWEIWNEPENRPAMWSGTDQNYFRLYRVAVGAIKKRYPHLKVGGPAVGASGQFVNGEFRATAFVTNFLRSAAVNLCRWTSFHGTVTPPIQPSL
jgi:hypothetical protein